MKFHQQLRWVGLGCILIGVLIVVIRTNRSGLPADMADELPQFYTAPPTLHRLYQLWFTGQRSESVAEFIRLLDAGDLGNYYYAAWIGWVSADTQLRGQVIAQLRKFVADSRPEIRAHTEEVISTIRQFTPLVAAPLTQLVIQRICREPDLAIKQKLLDRSHYTVGLAPAQQRTLLACIKTMPMNYELAQLLAWLNFFDAATADKICQAWIADADPYKLRNERLIHACLTKEQAVQAALTLFDQPITDSYTDSLFGASINALNADGRFNDAIINALLDHWPHLHTYRDKVRYLGDLGVYASPQVADRLADILMTGPVWQVMSVLGKLPVSPQGRANALRFYHQQIEDFSLEALYRYTALAMQADLATQKEAIAVNLAFWLAPKSDHLTLPPHSEPLLVNQLAVTLGHETTQHVLNTTLAISKDLQRATKTRTTLLENLPDLIITGDITTTTQIVEHLLDILANRDDVYVRGVAAAELAALRDQIKDDTTLTTRIVDHLLNVLNSNDGTYVRAVAAHSLVALILLVDEQRQLQLVQTLVTAITTFRETPAVYEDGSVDCTLYNNALEAVSNLVKSTGLQPALRRFIIDSSLPALLASSAPYNCRPPTQFIIIQKLAEASHLFDQTTAPTVSAHLLKLAGNPATYETRTTEAAIARIEAAQILDYDIALDVLLGRFQMARTNREYDSYGAALFLVALCAPAQRTNIYNNLVRLRSTSALPKAMAAGQVLTMIDTLARPPAVGARPLELEGQTGITSALSVAGLAVGDGQLFSPFCVW